MQLCKDEKAVNPKVDYPKNPALWYRPLVAEYTTVAVGTTLFKHIKGISHRSENHSIPLHGLSLTKLLS